MAPMATRTITIRLRDDRGRTYDLAVDLTDLGSAFLRGTQQSAATGSERTQLVGVVPPGTLVAGGPSYLEAEIIGVALGSES